jgi:hypothetical protein
LRTTPRHGAHADALDCERRRSPGHRSQQVGPQRLKGPKALEIGSGASHLFAERGALEVVVDYARNWLKRYLRHAQEPTSQSEHRRE